MDDPEADLRIAREAREDEEAIRKVCKEMRLEVVEVMAIFLEGYAAYPRVLD